MTKNVGGIDRIVRIVLGLALMSLYFLSEGNTRAWSLAGLVILFTGLSGFCGLYKLLGISTCAPSKTQA